MSENNTIIDNEEIKEFQTLNTDEIKKEVPSVDLNKTTTKGLRITERTKLRYNQAEKASGLSQEEFTNRLLDMCDFFEGSDLNKNPELIELTNIVNRIPEIFTSLISKQKTYEAGIITKHSTEIDSLKAINEEITQKYNELTEQNREDMEKLNSELEKVKVEAELKIKEQELEIAKIEKEKNDKDNEITTLKNTLKDTEDSFKKLKKENSEYEDKISTKSNEINILSKELQEAREQILDLDRKQLDIEVLTIKHNKDIELYKLQIENLEDKLKQQKEMYLEQIEHYKSLIK